MLNKKADRDITNSGIKMYRFATQYKNYRGSSGKVIQFQTENRGIKKPATKVATGFYEKGE